MEIQGQLWDRPVLIADIVYTPTYVSEHIINWLNPKGVCLDPCKGDAKIIIGMKEIFNPTK